MSKRTWNRLIGRNWDFYYLLKLEQLKIRRMAKYMKKRSIAASASFDYRDLTICDKLISIILEEDSITKVHVNEVVDKKCLTDIVYVNIRNEYRFFRATPIKNNMLASKPYRGEHGRNFRDKSGKIALRRLKAMHLYNLIREYRMFNWWD